MEYDDMVKLLRDMRDSAIRATMPGHYKRGYLKAVLDIAHFVERRHLADMFTQDEHWAKRGMK